MKATHKLRGNVRAPQWGPGSAPCTHHARRLNVVELRECLGEVGVAPAPDCVLRRRLAVLPVQRRGRRPPVDDPADRREAERVEPRVVGQIEEQLRRAGVRPGAREADGAAGVRVADGVVRNGPRGPGLAHPRVAGEPELRDEPRDHPEEPCTIVEPRAHQLVHPVAAPGRPITVHGNDDPPAVGRERHQKAVRRRGVSRPCGPARRGGVRTERREGRPNEQTSHRVTAPEPTAACASRDRTAGNWGTTRSGS